ncbi:G5 domain-containing protein [Bacillus infantis]|uniref:G5 domain-containing protein n=1 Tax=Bacillus infantis TaxID=324767 RepID=UPI003CEC7C64
MNKAQFLKLFLVLGISTAFILSFSKIGASAYVNVFSSDEIFGSGTRIGNVDVSGLTHDEALLKISSGQEVWRENTQLTFRYKEKEKSIPLEIFTFDLDESVKAAVNKNDNQLITTVDDNLLTELLQGISAELAEGKLDSSRLISDLRMYVAVLEDGSHMIKLDTYLPVSESEVVISEASITYHEASKDLADWAERFPSIEIDPQSRISILGILKENNIVYNERSLSIISSLIYRTVLSSNFTIAERHISRALPSFTEAGFEARADKNKNMDLIFLNPNDQSYKLKFSYSDDLFYVALTGQEYMYSYDVKLKDKETFKPKTVVQFDAKLKFGEKKTVVEGEEGLLVKVYRDSIDENGALLKSELISEDYYPPVHKVEVHSLTIKESLISPETSAPQVDAVPGDIGTSPVQEENTDSTDESGSLEDDKQEGAAGAMEKGTQTADGSSISDKEDNDGSLWGKPNEEPK